MRFLSFLFVLFTFVETTCSQVYPKLIVKGNYPDPSIIREGKDYYMTHSSFKECPGSLIWHSTDLVNWEPVCRVMTEYRGSQMAPDLVRYKGRYYLYYAAGNTNYVYWSDNIRGKWNGPVDLGYPGNDPGHVVGEDGKRYLFVASYDDNSFDILELADDGLSVVSKKKSSYKGWEIPKSWDTEGLWLESPKFLKYGDYYYLTSAEGGTAGPATSHMAVVARSKSIFGPWENSPYNPLIHTYDASEPWWSTGHATLIDDVNGNWWAVFHGYRRDDYPSGRQTLLAPIEFTPDGWFRAIKERKPLPERKVSGLEISDNFTSSELGLQWTFWEENGLSQISVGNGKLRVNGKGKGVDEARLMQVIGINDKAYTAEVSVDVLPKGKGGLMLFYSEKAYAGLLTDGRFLYIYRNKDLVSKIASKYGRKLRIRIVNRAGKMSIFAGKGLSDWDMIASDIDVSSFHHNVHLGFYSLCPTLVTLGKGKVSYSDFRYTSL